MVDKLPLKHFRYVKVLKSTGNGSFVIASIFQHDFTRLC